MSYVQVVTFRGAIGSWPRLGRAHLPTTNCTKAAFSEDNLNTPQRALPAISSLQTPITGATGGYIEVFYYWALTIIQRTYFFLYSSLECNLGKKYKLARLPLKIYDFCETKVIYFVRLDSRQWYSSSCKIALSLIFKCVLNKTAELTQTIQNRDTNRGRWIE